MNVISWNLFLWNKFENEKILQFTASRHFKLFWMFSVVVECSVNPSKAMKANSCDCVWVFVLEHQLANKFVCMKLSTFVYFFEKKLTVLIFSKRFVDCQRPQRENIVLWEVQRSLFFNFLCLGYSKLQTCNLAISSAKKQFFSNLLFLVCSANEKSNFLLKKCWKFKLQKKL